MLSGSGTAALYAQAAAVPEPPTEPVMAIHAYRMENQQAQDAVELVRPLLSSSGKADVHSDLKTVVIRDTLARIQRIAPMLARFDHPRQPVEVEIQIVRATSESFSPPIQTQVPEEMLAPLRKLLPYHAYRLIARTRLSSSEGEHLDYQLGESFGVNFRIGTLTEDDRLKLHGFRIVRGLRGEAAPSAEPRAASPTASPRRATPTTRQDDLGREILLHSNVNLRMGQTLYLGLAASEDSPEALMVVLTAVSPPQESRTLRAE
ncbi:MAG: hypothetical protein AAGD01_01010 [Acidobacteriota bacterium]